MGERRPGLTLAVLLAVALAIFSLWSMADSPDGPHDGPEFTPATVGPPVTVDMEGETP